LYQGTTSVVPKKLQKIAGLQPLREVLSRCKSIH